MVVILTPLFFLAQHCAFQQIFFWILYEFTCINLEEIPNNVFFGENIVHKLLFYARPLLLLAKLILDQVVLG